MIVLKQVYKCEVCGNIVEVMHASAGVLVCCGQSMILQVENVVDAAKEKHVPVVEKVDGGVLVKVGVVEHPMLEKHYIEWIEAQTENKIYRKYLNPGDKPQVLFLVEEEVLCVREYCNIHGLWKA
ncbi:MAG TPA: desulfoferrodoxin [Clostridiaceae bacterium]